MLQVAIVFTVACVILAANSVLSFLPNLLRGYSAPPLILYTEGVLSVLSCTLFLLGGAYAFVEIIRAKQGEHLATVVCRNYGTVVVEDDVADEEEKVEAKLRRGSIRIAVEEVLERTTSLARTISLTPNEKDQYPAASLRWHALPTFYELRTEYFTKLEFVASLISVTSSFVFTISAVLALISIFRTNEIATWIRYPQLGAGAGFAVSSWLAMVQAQQSWWRPALRKMVWHANLLNLIGSLGFILCSILGLLKHNWADFGFGCTFLWGSWAYLIASAMSSYNVYRRRRVEMETSKV